MSRNVSPPPVTKHVFRVNVRSTDYLWILVEADDEQHAQQLARQIDAGFFHADWPKSDWEIVDAEPASDYDPDQVAPPEAYSAL